MIPPPSPGADALSQESVPSSDAARAWGIAPVPWLCTTHLRILFVTDGRINIDHGPQDFGLGPVLDTLRDPLFAWWVRIEVDVVNRDAPRAFRFIEQGFDIDDFDQIWFFGDWPGLEANDPAFGDDGIELADYAPLQDEELLVVAEWMERGGGVFATGDHSLLGASMCYRIPRVRTMRRWTRAQSVPSFGDEDRHETLQHYYQTGELAWEGDEWPQRIYPILTRDDSRHPGAFYGAFPHPLLCGRAGVIDRFPDHMHEGGVFENDEVKLNEPLGIPGFDGVEYPILEPEFQLAGLGHPEPFGVRPKPQVVAHAWTTNPELEQRRFAVVGAYDGDAVGLGRVVVDSTWHHWLSLNLVGFKEKAPAIYRGMQDYYRNVALWLATPQQRASMLFAATWGVVVGIQPGAFHQVMGIWEIGARVVDVLGRTAPQCILSELVATFATPSISPGREERPQNQPPLAPSLGKVVDQAIVGGIAYGLLEQAQHHIVERAHGRVTALNADAVRSGALAGLAEGRRALAAMLGADARGLKTLSDQFSSQDEQTHLRDIPIDALVQEYPDDLTKG